MSSALYGRDAQAGEDFLERRNFFQRDAQGQQVAAVARTGAEPSERSFKVAHFAKVLPEIIQRDGVGNPQPDGLAPARDGNFGRQRLAEPIAQPPRPHRSHRAIERAVKTSLARRTGLQRLQDFQVS